MGGNLIPMTSVVNDMQEFSARAETVFREAYNLEEDINYRDAGFDFLGNKFKLPANYAFLGDSIRLHYNPYEIAAYAMGEFEITVAIN